MLKLDPITVITHDKYRGSAGHLTRCYAPSTSMYFDQFGNVLACCLNALHPMGSYPAQRIADIWTSSEAKALRHALADDDFSLGCHDCHSSISSGNFRTVSALFDEVASATSAEWLMQHPAIAEDGRDPWPRMLEFALSTRCNLKCTMCSAYFSSAIRRSKGLEPLPEIYGAEFVDELRPFLEHALEVRFYGGEPFMADINYLVLEAIAEVNPDCRVGITTNGTVWTSRVQRVLERLNMVSIVISIDGASATTFESIRSGARHEQVMANLDRFVKIEGCTVSIASCPMLQNWNEISDLVSYANDRAMSIGFNIVRYPQDHSLSSAPTALLEKVVHRWTIELDELRLSSKSQQSVENVDRFAFILAEVEGWLAASKPVESAVLLRSSSAASSRSRRKDWLELLANMSRTSWNLLAIESEEDYLFEVNRLLDVFRATVPVEDHGQLVASALARYVEASTDETHSRFRRLGEALNKGSVVRRVLLMSGMPPALIAQGVANVEPDTIETRIDSFFPPEGSEAAQVGSNKIDLVSDQP